MTAHQQRACHSTGFGLRLGYLGEWLDFLSVGARMKLSPEWTLRAGFSTGNQPIPGSEVMFNILAPGVIENHLTFGLSRMLGDSRELIISITRAFSKSIKGTNPPEIPGRQSIELKMNQWEFGAGVTF